MKITYLPHAREQMEERGISEEEVEVALKFAEVDYPGNKGRRVAETIQEGRRLATKVAYNLGSLEEDERIVISVMLGRPSSRLRRAREERRRSGE